MIESWLVPLWDATPRPLLAGGLGLIAAIVSLPLIRHCLVICDAAPASLPWKSAIATGILVGLFAWLMLQFGVQRIDEVRPGPVWDRLRIIHHAVLITLLAAATVTDWRTCFIPNFIPYIGIVLGIALAVISGDLQMSHAWVDWNQAVPGFLGPALPAWMDAHRHLHGLVWSLAGALCGAFATAAVRLVARWAMGVTALGSGDVWLMAMIGAYLGWQATLIAFLLAPLLALAVGLPLKLMTGRPYIPYGPFLAAAAIVVLCLWRWIWTFEVNFGSTLPRADRRSMFSVRRLFGDPLALVGIAIVVLIALAVMLAWTRWKAGWQIQRSVSQPADRA
jgi:leader peptidase (prepilin peptidase)/N-methyltransferase